MLPSLYLGFISHAPLTVSHQLGYGTVAGQYDFLVDASGQPRELLMWGINLYTGGHFDDYRVYYTSFHAGHIADDVFDFDSSNCTCWALYVFDSSNCTQRTTHVLENCAHAGAYESFFHAGAYDSFFLFFMFYCISSCDGTWYHHVAPPHASHQHDASFTSPQVCTGTNLHHSQTLTGTKLQGIGEDPEHPSHMPGSGAAAAARVLPNVHHGDPEYDAFVHKRCVVHGVVEEVGQGTAVCCGLCSKCCSGVVAR